MLSKLDPSIEIHASISVKLSSGEFVLLPETIEVINLVAYSLEPDDPGLVVQLSVKADIHRALSLLGSPIAPGATQNASVLLFRAWLQNAAQLSPGVTPAHKVPGLYTDAWHHLSDEQADHIVWHSWHSILWSTSIANAIPPLRVADVLKIVPGGVQRTHMYALPIF